MAKIKFNSAQQNKYKNRMCDYIAKRVLYYIQDMLKKLNKLTNT